MLSIVVPFHNEEKNVALVLECYLPFKDAYDFELICVDDASSDNTEQVLKKFLSNQEYRFVKLVSISQEDHRGYGHAIMSGLRTVQGDILAWSHADLQTDPADVFRAFDEFLKEKNESVLVRGRRIGRPWSQVLFSFGMAVTASILLRKVFFEINAQPKLFHRSFLRYLHNAPSDFSLDLFLLYQAKKHHYQIRAINVLFKKRLYGKSKWAFSFSSKVRTIRRTINYILELKKIV